MKFQVTSIQNSMITTELFPVNGEPHNVKFSHVKRHRIFFQVSHLPRKSIAKWLADNEPGEVVEVKGFIKSVIQVNQTVLQFVLCYKVKTSADFQPKRGLTNQYVVTEKKSLLCRPQKMKSSDLWNPTYLSWSGTMERNLRMISKLISWSGRIH
ncbi:hypothetical protein D5272_01665 [bacterium D16-76]|nr:hypothetical protein [bacterium D16-76]